ncbi:hypothetical protein PV326_003490, partial [Microctonus aethiopoides]
MSQRDSSPVDGDNTDDIQSRNIIRTPNKPIDNHEQDNHDENETAINRDWTGTNHSAIQELNNSHRNIVESPLEQIIGSIRQSHKRSNKSPIFLNDSTYNTERLGLSDLADIATTNVVGRIDSMDSPKSRLHYPQNHQNNTHCQQQRILLPGASSNSYLHQHQHLVNEGNVANTDNRINYRHCPIADDQHRHISRNKNNDDRSTSPTSSSDAEFHSSSRYSRNNRQHSSHRHRHNNTNNDNNIYQKAINNNQLENQHSSIKKQHINNICHRYHEIGQPLTSCSSPMCDSSMRCDDDCSSSSILSNNRERSSSCEDINGTMCSLMATTTTSSTTTSATAIATTTSTTIQSSNLVSQLPIVSVGNYHHHHHHHHRASSGISCESSTSSALTRNHGINENCMSIERHLNSSRHNHHVIQPYALDHSQRVQNIHARETKSPLLIGFETIQQISSTPSKNKCQCHIDHLSQQQIQSHQQQQQQHHQQQHHHQHQQDHQSQQQQQSQQAHHHHHHHYHQHQQYGNQDKHSPEGENDGVNMVTINSRRHQPPALPPRPPPRPNRRYETSAYDS